MTISETVTRAFNLADEAITSLEINGSVRKEIDIVIDTSINSLINTVQDFIDYALEYIKTDFASCGPLMNVYDLVENTLCDRILSPFNGIWTGIGLYLILFIPIVILSCMLEPLFRRYKKAAYKKEDHVEMMGNFLRFTLIIQL